MFCSATPPPLPPADAVTQDAAVSWLQQMGDSAANADKHYFYLNAGRIVLLASIAATAVAAVLLGMGLCACKRHMKPVLLLSLLPALAGALGHTAAMGVWLAVDRLALKDSPMTSQLSSSWILQVVAAGMTLLGAIMTVLAGLTRPPPVDPRASKV
jgi:DNA-binding transcriptional LysR family regulator